MRASRRSRSFSSNRASSRDSIVERQSKPFETYMMTNSSFEGATSESEINDSRFNDISSISLADRTIDEKDTESRNDQNTSRSSANNLSNETKNSSDLLGASSLSSSKDNSLTHKRNFSSAFNTSSASSSNSSSGSSAKRLKRNTAATANTCFKKCNPMTQAIPILGQSKLPPDRSALLSGSASLAAAASALNSANAATSHANADTRNNAASCSRASRSLNDWLAMGNNCAKLMNAKCVSTNLSKSYKEESLRFTCQNGHNFFLSTSNLLKTHTALSACNKLSDTLLSNLNWCNKCEKFFAKVKTLALRLGLTVLGGLHSKNIELKCNRSNHRFSIHYHKKFEQIACLKCRSNDKELHREQLRRAEELENAALLAE